MLGLSLAASAGLALVPGLAAAPGGRKVVVWSEGTANVDPGSKKVYPNDVNTAMAEGLKPLEAEGWEIVTASLKDPDQGVSDELLKSTDVLIWWGHKKHGDVKDELVNRIADRVKQEGMGFISVHSSHYAKPYKKLMGTPCSWGEYQADGTSVKITVKEPNHPIAKGVKDFSLPKIERYGEPFKVPTPEAVPFDGDLHPPRRPDPARPHGLVLDGRQGTGLLPDAGPRDLRRLLPARDPADSAQRRAVGRPLQVAALQMAALCREPLRRAVHGALLAKPEGSQEIMP